MDLLSVTRNQEEEEEEEEEETVKCRTTEGRVYRSMAFDRPKLHSNRGRSTTLIVPWTD